MTISANFLKRYIKFPTSKPPIIAEASAQNITIPHIQSFCQKILKLKKEHNNIECITDYDHTLTKFKYQGKRCDSLFGMWVANQNLPQKFRQELMNNYLFYGPYETDGTITFLEKYELINQFYYVQTKLFETHKLTVQQANQTLQKSNLVFRPYTRRLFEVLHEGEIPMYIISGGISDIIYTSIHDVFGQVYPNISIHSNQFEMYQIHQQHGGHVLVDYKTSDFWNSIQTQPQSNQDRTKTQSRSQSKSPYHIKFRKPIIHSYNKFEIMKNHTSKRKNCILMGDLQSDIYMARGVKYETILSIFYAKQGDTDQRAYAQQKFDLIVEGDGSHKIVVQLIKIIKGKKNINWEYLSSVHRNLHEYLF